MCYHNGNQTVEAEIKPDKAQYRERAEAEKPYELPAGKWTAEGRGKGFFADIAKAEYRGRDSA